MIDPTRLKVAQNPLQETLPNPAVGSINLWSVFVPKFEASVSNTSHQSRLKCKRRSELSSEGQFQSRAVSVKLTEGCCEIDLKLILLSEGDIKRLIPPERRITAAERLINATMLVTPVSSELKQSGCVTLLLLFHQHQEQHVPLFKT